MSFIGTQPAAEKYAIERAAKGDCIEIYYRAEEDEFIAAGSNSDEPKDSVFFGVFKLVNNRVQFSLTKCN